MYLLVLLLLCLDVMFTNVVCQDEMSTATASTINSPNTDTPPSSPSTPPSSTDTTTSSTTQNTAATTQSASAGTTETPRGEKLDREFENHMDKCHRNFEL